MVRKKKIREKGKVQLSRYFQELNNGDSVAVVKEPSKKLGFPKRLQGKTGLVQEKIGSSYFVQIKDQAKEKKFLIAPIHLKKIQNKLKW